MSKSSGEYRRSKAVGTEEVMQMITTVLENNGKQYIQKEGMAIGSRLGRNFACVYMREWDEEIGKFGKQPLFTSGS